MNCGIGSKSKVVALVEPEISSLNLGVVNWGQTYSGIVIELSKYDMLLPLTDKAMFTDGVRCVYLRPFLTVEVEVAVQLLYCYLYKKQHTFVVLTYGPFGGGRGAVILRPDFFRPFLKSRHFGIWSFWVCQTTRLIKEYPGKITPSSQIQKLMKLWAVVVNCGIPPWVVAGHFKKTLASPNKKYTYVPNNQTTHNFHGLNSSA